MPSPSGQKRGQLKRKSNKPLARVVNFGLREQLREVVQVMAAKARKKKLQLSSYVHPDVPEQLRGDTLRLRQALRYLIHNSLKWTDEGDVALRVMGEQEKDGTAILHFSVSDTGTGLTPAKQKKIQKAFIRPLVSTSSKPGESGDGLAACKGLADPPHGDFWMESAPGLGSTLHLRAPFELCNKSLNVETGGEFVSFPGICALIVDDSSATRELLQNMLSGWGIQPTTCESARSAVREMGAAHAQGRSFRLVLLDSQMPGTDGFFVAEWMLQKDQLAKTALIMLLSATGDHTSARFREIGVIECLRKPVKRAELLRAIQRSLGAPESPKCSAFQVGDVVPQDDATGLRVLLAESTPANRARALKILQMRNHSVVVAENAEQVVTAIDKEQFDLILLDMQMPRLDGMQFAKRTRKQEENSPKHAPIIGLSTSAQDGARASCLQAGMDDCVLKPVQQAELLAAIERTILLTDPDDPVCMDAAAASARSDGQPWAGNATPPGRSGEGGRFHQDFLYSKKS